MLVSNKTVICSTALTISIVSYEIMLKQVYIIEDDLPRK